MLERDFQGKLIRRIRDRFPGCFVLKNDPNYIPGFPDLLILYGDRWAALECKQSAHSGHRPNQDYYIERLGAMSFASFIFPENEEEVMNELQRAFQS